MIEAIGSGTNIQQLTAVRPAPERSGALPEAPSAFDIAQQIQGVQVENLKRTLEAQTLVLDLLV